MRGQENGFITVFGVNIANRFWHLPGFASKIMSQLHQMQLSYVATEDRILFRVNTKARQEFRFWMTRRYAKVLWDAVSRLLQSQQKVDQPESGSQPAVDPKVRDELIKSVEIKRSHKEQVEKSDFQTQYQESQYLPLGEEPVLLFGVGVKSGNGKQPLLCMHPKDGRGIELALNEQIAHSLCKLIRDSAEKAQWGLELSFAKQDEKKLPEGLN